MKTIFFLLINFHIHHYFAVNLLCIHKNEGEEHKFFLFVQNCLRNQMELKINLHFGWQMGREYFFLKDVSRSHPRVSSISKYTTPFSVFLYKNTINWVAYKQQKLVSHGSGV